MWNSSLSRPTFRLTVMAAVPIASALSFAMGSGLSAEAAECPTGFVENDGSFPVGQLGYLEQDDAGALLDDAQAIAHCPGSLDFIYGQLSDSDPVDLFKFSITDDEPFSAGLYSFSPGYALDYDSQLFLFDSAGKGLFANDDRPLVPGTTFPDKTLTEVSAISRIDDISLPVGDYFLGISAFDIDPWGDNGEIFPDAPYQAVVGPTGPGGDDPLSQWAGAGGSTSGDYLIELTGVSALASTSNSTWNSDSSESVPEGPFGLGLGLVGLWAGLRWRSRHSV